MRRVIAGIDASRKNRRRILRRIAVDDVTALGDTSTLVDPEIVDNLIVNRGAQR